MTKMTKTAKEHFGGLKFGEKCLILNIAESKTKQFEIFLNLLTSNRYDFDRWLELFYDTDDFPSSDDLIRWSCEDLFRYLHLACPLIEHREGVEMVAKYFLQNVQEIFEIYYDFKKELRMIWEFEDMYLRYDDNENPDKEEPPAPIPFD